MTRFAETLCELASLALLMGALLAFWIGTP